jgi:hypothetical protein
VDAKLLDTHRIEVDIPGAAGGLTTLTVSRHYATVEQLDREIVNARVWAGLHFRDSGETGVKLGRDVAHWTLDRYFLPTNNESKMSDQERDNPVNATDKDEGGKVEADTHGHRDADITTGDDSNHVKAHNHGGK